MPGGDGLDCSFSSCLVLSGSIQLLTQRSNISLADWLAYRLGITRESEVGNQVGPSASCRDFKAKFIKSRGRVKVSDRRKIKGRTAQSILCVLCVLANNIDIDLIVSGFTNISLSSNSYFPILVYVVVKLTHHCQSVL